MSILNKIRINFNFPLFLFFCFGFLIIYVNAFGNIYMYNLFLKVF